MPTIEQIVDFVYWPSWLAALVLAVWSVSRGKHSTGILGIGYAAGVLVSRFVYWLIL